MSSSGCVTLCTTYFKQNGCHMQFYITVWERKACQLRLNKNYQTLSLSVVQFRWICMDEVLRKCKKKGLENRTCKQIQDLHASFGIKERRKHRGRSRNCTYPYTRSTQRGWNWAFFPLLAAISRIQAIFQNWHIWAWKLAIGKTSRSCKYTLSTQRVEIELIFTLGRAVSEILTIYQNCLI